MKLAVIVLATLLSSAAGAQSVWRCGDEGHTRYTDTSCAGGRTVEAADTRTSAQAQSAQAVVQRDRALARELAQQRRQLERDNAAHGNGLVAIQPQPAAEIKPKSAKAKPKKPRREAPATYRAVAVVSR